MSSNHLHTPARATSTTSAALKTSISLQLALSGLSLIACEGERKTSMNPCATSRDEERGVVVIECEGAAPVELFDGRDGRDGRDGEDGRQGMDGLSGLDGRDGRDGQDGQDGRDAVAGAGGHSVGPVEDRDLDGFSEAEGDCDDLNDTVYPGARERGLDSVDSDCDGEVQPALSDNVLTPALLAEIDLNGDGEISLGEFEARCALSAQLTSEALPGVVQVHAACSGVNSCRGMVLQSWGDVYEHDCRGVNTCSGWSCVEAAPDLGRTGEELFAQGECANCHGGGDAFGVYVPEGQDEAAFIADFAARPPETLIASIAFGVSSVTSSGIASSNMPAQYTRFSRAEMLTLATYIQSLTLQPSPLAEPTRD